MKKRRLSLIALVLACVMLFTTVSFAAETNASTIDTAATGTALNAETTAPDSLLIANQDSDLPVYMTTEYDIWLMPSSDKIKTNWDRSGCQLDAQFLTGDYLLRRLRLTFDEAYDLYDRHNTLQNANTISTVMATTTGNSKTLRNLLSNSTYRNCLGADGIETLRNLKNYSEYRNNSQVRRIVNDALYDIDTFYVPRLRESLEYFYPAFLLKNATYQQLLELGNLVISTPEYIQFHNTLYYHDCNVVRSIMNQGYSLNYVVRLYTDQAEAAVKAIWPDYLDRISDYWYEYRTW